MLSEGDQGKETAARLARVEIHRHQPLVRRRSLAVVVFWRQYAELEWEQEYSHRSKR